MRPQGGRPYAGEGPSGIRAPSDGAQGNAIQRKRMYVP